MTTITTSKPGWLLCVSGADCALKRAKASLADQRGSDAEALRSICECIWWIATAEEMLLEAHGKSYKKWRAASGMAERLMALRWARNRIAHQDSQWSIIAPPFSWAPEALIPVPSDPEYDHGRNEYGAELERKEIIPVLSEIPDALTNYAAKFKW